MGLFSFIIFLSIASSIVMQGTVQSFNSKNDVSKTTMTTDTGDVSFIRRKDLFISQYAEYEYKIGTGRQETVTLISHCSLENLHFVDSLAASWDGPISIAVFIDRDDSELLMHVQYYYQCFQHIRANTTFHVMYPETMDLRITEIDCQEFIASLKEFPMYIRPLKGIAYPHNALRNLATPSKGNAYVFHIDIDLVPSSNLHDDFLKYAETLDDNILESSIFIVASFECKHDTNIPRTKLELIRRSLNREIRTFYSKACWGCQYNTNYKKWKYLKTKEMTTYEIESKFYNYEPYYIVRTDRFIPYNESFFGRGYDRISQVSEVWMAGFRFLVLTDGFLVHRGFHDLDKPRGVKCPIRKRKAFEDDCVKTKEKDIFEQIVFEINEKRHFNRNRKDEIRNMDEEFKNWITLNDPNRELFWSWIEELERKYNGTDRILSQEWYFTKEKQEHVRDDNMTNSLI